MIERCKRFLLGNILSAILDDDALVILRNTLTGEVVGCVRHLLVINYAFDASRICWCNGTTYYLVREVLLTGSVNQILKSLTFLLVLQIPFNVLDGVVTSILDLSQVEYHSLDIFFLMRRNYEVSLEVLLGGSEVNITNATSSVITRLCMTLC